jgi:hypothetical protein
MTHVCLLLAAACCCCCCCKSIRLPAAAAAAGEVLEVQAASNNTIKGALTAPGEPSDRQALITAATGGLLHASGQATSPALQAGVSISAADAAAHLAQQAAGSGSGPDAAAPSADESSSGASKSVIHEGPPREVHPHGLTPPSGGGSGGNAQLLRLYQPDVDEFQVCLEHIMQTSQAAVQPMLDHGQR